ncbi:Histone deacetylase 6 [Armadillidium nasatum]|uniref:Histone deacetylase 6 n=1 Tax=Armadillidium nasatum TaxID=96803 RepID=A0A5N5SMQ4_9CRUS|nr:Histone deacetylase 6 [Armadillidium nasatum]
MTRRKTGIIFDERMNEHYNPWDENFPEKPERLTAVLQRCKRIGPFLRIESQYKSVEECKNLTMKYEDVYINQKTFDASLLSAGCSLEITKRVLDGEVQNGMAIVRPPGHHAMNNAFCGFCIFNNAALSAHYALTRVKRILIVDWDIHHGQGTQRMFYNDPRVLYVSSHRYENGKYWPHLRESNYDFCGEGKGRGYNINIPLNEIGMRNEDFLAYFHQVLLPVAYEFSPELVLISCGFDAALGCPEGEMRVTPAMYAHLTSMLMTLAGGKVVSLLEGGYCLESLAESSALALRTLMGKPCPRLVDPLGQPCSSMVETILNIIYMHRFKWKCLKFQSAFDEEQEEYETKFSLLPKHIPHFEFGGKDEPPPGTIFPIELYVYERTLEEIEILLKELLRLKHETSLNTAPKDVCLVYDADMEKHCNVVDKNYPERPARTKEIMKKLDEFGILKRVTRLKSRRASRLELNLFHENKYIDFMVEINVLAPRERIRLEEDYESIYFHKDTWDCAILATGSLLQVVDSVCTGEHQSGVAVIRPPGHHAECATPYGFCFFNNVCIAAKYALQKYSLKRILILDWDIHHGNGIQHCFESDPNVLYISIHLYRNGNFFPFSREADADFVGKGPGRGYNINIPWSKSGMGDGDYISAFMQVVLPVAYEYNPDLVFVSAGFDAAINDPLGGCCVTPECFGHLTRLLSSLANGNVILTLEGGYNLTSISYSMLMCTKALLGDPLPSLNVGLHPSSSAVEDIMDVIAVHKQFWSSLKFQVALPKLKEESSLLVKPRQKEEMSDAEYFTPPTSPASGNKNTSAVDNMKAEDTLIASFSNMTAGCDGMATGGQTDNDEAMSCRELLEGAVGMDATSQMTIAQMLQGESEMHAVVPLSWCPHLSDVRPIPESGLKVVDSRCELCNDPKENWQCLTCYKILCGRYVREHMIEHGITENHNIVLSHLDLSVWCYSCESYVYNEFYMLN